MTIQKSLEDNAASHLKKSHVPVGYVPTEERLFHDEEQARHKKHYTAPRQAAVGGEKIAEDLLKVFAASKGYDTASSKWKMFSEIVDRCVYDVAGGVYATNEHGKTYNGFDDIFESFAIHKEAIRTQNDAIDAMNAEQKKNWENPTLQTHVPYRYGEAAAAPAKGMNAEEPRSESAWRKVLNYIPLYKKGIVQTPHPTEMLDKDAIRAVNALHAEIEISGKLFVQLAAGEGEFSLEDQARLIARMEKVYESLKPVNAAIKIRNEINRSIEASELPFNAVPYIMESVLDPAIRHNQRNEAHLSTDELRHFSRLIEPCTWSPGDRDSKPDMTTDELAYGVAQNKTIMSMQYAVKIAEMLHEMPKPTVTTPPRQQVAYLELEIALSRILKGIESGRLPSVKAPVEPEENAAAGDGSNAIPNKAASSDAKEATVGDKFLSLYLGKPGEPGYEERQSVVSKIRIYANAQPVPKPPTGFPVVDEKNARRFQKYSSVGEMVKALEDVHDLQGNARKNLRGLTEEEINHLPDEVKNYPDGGSAVFPPHVSENGAKHKVISKLDVLVAQMYAFGDYALRPQIRENAEMHEKVFKELVNLPVFAEALSGAGNDKQKVRLLLELLENPEKANALRAAISEKLEADAKIIIPVRKEIKLLNPKTDQKKIDALKSSIEHLEPLYETLSGMRLAAEHPDAIPQYLIAECRHGTDILEAFALLKLMEPEGMAKHVEIVPLVEHRPHVDSIVKMMKEAYKNPSFAAHHAAISEKSLGLLHENSMGVTINGQPVASEILHPDEKMKEAIKKEEIKRPEFGKLNTKLDPQYERITVAQVKKAYGLQAKKGDDKKLIHHTKMVMFAGSDIMKSAGPAGAAFTQHAIADLRKEMLDMDTPVLLVDYTGSGGGLHRSQPVSTSYETVQGRSMRQTARANAQKTVSGMAYYVKRMLGVTSTAQQYEKEAEAIQENGNDVTLPANNKKLGVIAQLNLGNLAGFPVKEEEWSKADGTGVRCSAAMDAYQELYKSPEFACMMAFSADKYAKLTSYAARPPGRINSASEVPAYPTVVDVGGLRAIGYGTALNISGSCTSMYYGDSQFLHADDILNQKEGAMKSLVELYLHDSRTQDVVNRATFGTIMADMDAAWHYMGMERTVQNGEVTVRDSTVTDSQPQSVKALAAKDEAKAAAIIERYQQEVGNRKREAQIKWLGKLSVEDKRTLAVHSLAQVDVEHQKVSQVLLRLHSIVTLKTSPEPDLATIQDQLLQTLPKALQAQITHSRNNIKNARQTLAQEFLDSWRNPDHYLRKEVKEIRTEKSNADHYNDIYFKVGACNECFENAPRALTRPWWAAKLENGINGHQKAA